MASKWLAKENFRDSLLISSKFNSFWDVYKRGLTVFFLLKGGLLLVRQQQRWSDSSFLLPVLSVTLNYLLPWFLTTILTCLLGAISACCKPRVYSCLVGFLHLLYMFLEYGMSIFLVVVSVMGFHKNLFVGNDHSLASFFLNSLIFFALMIVKDFLDLCWIRTLISEHVFNMDLENYLVDEKTVEGIRKDIQEIRKIQIEHAVDVDTKDPNIHVLFDERFSEDRIREFENNRLRKLANGGGEDEEEARHIKKKAKPQVGEPSTELSTARALEDPQSQTA